MTTTVVIPDIVRRNELPEIWAAHEAAVSKCYCNPTRWHYRPDCEFLQFLGIYNKVPMLPYGVEEIERLTDEKVVLEEKIQAAAMPICNKWGGLTLLTPQQVHAEEHCIREYHLVSPEVEPGYAQICPVNGGYALRGAVWGPELDVQVVKTAVRRDNGPGISELTTEFVLPNGSKVKSWLCGGGFAAMSWRRRVVSGEMPETPRPKNPFNDGMIHERRSGHSSAQSEQKVLRIQFSVELYQHIPGFGPRQD